MHLRRSTVDAGTSGARAFTASGYQAVKKCTEVSVRRSQCTAAYVVNGALPYVLRILHGGSMLLPPADPPLR